MGKEGGRGKDLWREGRCWIEGRSWEEGIGGMKLGLKREDGIGGKELEELESTEGRSCREARRWMKAL